MSEAPKTREDTYYYVEHTVSGLLYMTRTLDPEAQQVLETWYRADLVQFQINAAVAAEREACAEEVWHECYPSTNQGHLNARQLAEADTTEDAVAAIRARTDIDAQAALERVKREAQNEALDAASEYLKTVYGNSPLSHPVDRKRILELMEDHSDE